MQDNFFEEIQSELQLGITVKGHPYRFFALASMGLKQTIGLRTVVLRNVTKDLQLTFYTDARSPKIKELKTNNTVTALFYDPAKMIQLRIEGNASIEADEAVLKKHWETVPNNAHKDYNTTNPPGNLIASPEEVHYLSKDNHFAMVHIIPYRIDYLKLGREQHTRVQLSLVNAQWEHKFLVP